MSTQEFTKDRFLNSVRNHTLEVVQDNGLHRHLVLSNQGSFNQKIEIVTWPGHLWVGHDMGTYSFRRLDDMFGFFRQEEGGEWGINPRYWQEKLTAQCSISGVQEFCQEKFEAAMKSELDEFECAGNEYESEEEVREGIWEDIKGTILYEGFSDLGCALQAVQEFESNGFRFDECFHENDLQNYTYHYLWSCCAIVWGIQQYDAWKASKEAA